MGFSKREQVINKLTRPAVSGQKEIKMKRYICTDDLRNDYKHVKIDLGCSDMACLVLRSGPKLDFLQFNIDENYSAWYVSDPEVEIPGHYSLVFTSENWLKIYDDSECVFSESGSF